MFDEFFTICWPYIVVALVINGIMVRRILHKRVDATEKSGEGGDGCGFAKKE